MPELIYRESLLELLRDCEAVTHSVGYSDMIAIIEDIPTIDAEPVRHGRWVNDVFCSECKRFPVDVSVSISNRELTKYFSRCPHCGAVMDAQDGGAENANN